jgi:type IV pilus assembly protein PilM
LEREFHLKFDFFKESIPPLVGVDISATSVKMVKLAGDKRAGYFLESYASSPLPKDAIVDGNINDLEKVGDAVRLTWKLLGIKEKRAALALPNSAVISKKVMMQTDMTEDEMTAQVESEANQYIPFSLDEVNLDFQVLGAPAKDAAESEVLIVAARKEKIEDRVAAAESANLKVDVMDVESYATEAAFSLIAHQLQKSGRDQTAMIIDIGASITHINVVHDGQSIYSREQNFGGNQLTQEIQRRFGLSPEEAEIAKKKSGLPDSYESEVLQPFMQLIGNEVTRALQFFNTATHDNQKIQHIILAGGCASISGIDAVVQQMTGIHTIIANPFEKMKLATKLKPQQVAKDAPALLIACGLALRGVAA